MFFLQWQDWALAHSLAHNVNKYPPAVQHIWLGWHWRLGRFIMPPPRIDWLTKLLLNTKTGIKEQKLHKDLQFMPKSPKGEVLPIS